MHVFSAWRYNNSLNTEIFQKMTALIPNGIEDFIWGLLPVFMIKELWICLVLERDVLCFLIEISISNVDFNYRFVIIGLSLIMALEMDFVSP